MSEPRPNSPFALHDATLLGIDYDWKARRLRLRIRRGREHDGAWALRATGVASFSCASEWPWGPSVSINGVDGPVALEGGRARLEIEMQTGDRIVIAAEHFALVREDERLDAWLDGGSVQLVAVSSFGDPLDCSDTEARIFAERILALLAFEDITADSIGGARWPPGWQPVGDDRATLEAELHRELGPDHALAGKKVIALARRPDGDDALFLVEQPQPELAIVHLTWAGRPEPSPQWPAVRRFPTVAAFLRACAPMEE